MLWDDNCSDKGGGFRLPQCALLTCSVHAPERMCLCHCCCAHCCCAHCCCAHCCCTHCCTPAAACRVVAPLTVQTLPATGSSSSSSAGLLTCLHAAASSRGAGAASRWQHPRAYSFASCGGLRQEMTFARASRTGCVWGLVWGGVLCSVVVCSTV